MKILIVLAFPESLEGGGGGVDAGDLGVRSATWSPPSVNRAEACGSRSQTFNSQLTANDDVAASAKFQLESIGVRTITCGISPRERNECFLQGLAGSAIHQCQLMTSRGINDLRVSTGAVLLDYAVKGIEGQSNVD
jgi:hypothetical protein